MPKNVTREELVAAFEDTLACANGFVLSQRTRQSMMLTEVYESGFCSRTRWFDRNGKLCFLPMTTFQAARAIYRWQENASVNWQDMACQRVQDDGKQSERTVSDADTIALSPDGKTASFMQDAFCASPNSDSRGSSTENTDRIAVLNFANPVEPGGGVRWGAVAQEECLCRSSSLYLSLSQEKVRRAFYHQHDREGQIIASDRVVLVPDVVVFKSDDILPVNLSVEDWMQVDVLTCAAPYYPGLPDRTDVFLLELYRSRVRNIFECALANQIDVLVLGAFGCGAFQNPPYLMAKAFCDEIKEQKYLNAFSVIVFAIPEDGGRSSQNLRSFQNVFAQRFQQFCFENGPQEYSELQKDPGILFQTEIHIQKGTFPEKAIRLPSGKLLRGTERESYLQWRKENPYCGKYFSILGDSISTYEKMVPDGYNVFYEKEMRERSGVCRPENTWWSQAVRFLGGQVLVDNAWSGSRVTPTPGASMRFPSGCSSYRTGGLHLGTKRPDVIVVFLGTNDWANAVPVYPEKEKGGFLASLRRLFRGKREKEKRQALPPTFAEAYEAILSQICRYYPQTEIWCCTLGITRIRDLPQWEFPRAYAGIPINLYNRTIRILAGRYGARVITFDDPPFSFETVDGSHPTVRGMQELAVQAILSLADDLGKGYLFTGGDAKTRHLS